MMGNVALVLLTVLLLQLGVACAWGVGIWAMDLPRRPAWHWLASGLLCALAMALVLLRDVLPLAVGVSGSNLVMLGTALVLGRGMRLFLGLPPGDRETGVLLAVFLVLSALAWPELRSASGVRLQALTTTLSLIAVLARTSALGYRALAAEFGQRPALVLIAPLALASLMAGMRLVSMVGSQARPLQVDAPLHVAVALLLLVALLMLHGSMAAMVVMRLVGRLRELSQRDTLTGLLNRGEWLRQLRAQHRWLGRHGDSFALLMIDIDHFKQVNDRWGHPAGDAVLVNVAQELLTSSRSLDVVGRLGGEEFVVLTPRSDAAAALRLAERLRSQLAASQIEWRGEPLSVTVSIGVAVAEDADEAPAEVMARADAALYRAKHAGRNRVELDRPGAAGGVPEAATPLRTARAPAAGTEPPERSRRGPGGRSASLPDFADTA